MGTVTLDGQSLLLVSSTHLQMEDSTIPLTEEEKRDLKIQSIVFRLAKHRLAPPYYDLYSPGAWQKVINENVFYFHDYSHLAYVEKYVKRQPGWADKQAAKIKHLREASKWQLEDWEVLAEQLEVPPLTSFSLSLLRC